MSQSTSRYLGKQLYSIMSDYSSSAARRGGLPSVVVSGFSAHQLCLHCLVPRRRPTFVPCKKKNIL